MGVVPVGAAPPRWQLYAGMPCWIELVTPDVDSAREFYAALFGWSYEQRTDSEGGHHLLALHEGFPVASLRTTASGEDAKWRLFLATGDCRAACEQAVERGACVTVAPSRLDGIGTKVVLEGPSDAEFGLLEPEASWQFDVGLPGTLMWAELVTIKAQTADLFFQDLFGYTDAQFGTENHLDYSVWYLGEESVLARVSMLREHIDAETRPHWLLYLGVSEEVGTDEAVRRAVGAHGRVRVDPYDSALGRAAVLRDPTGARFALVDPSRAPVGDAANYDPYED
ncbi:VOC family protein [Actinopolyspora mortivallis]|uniref:Glyoxalase n=1 Tax=Actinopolyspora mortivallis TaxID=33906 RepID=A0A2T0H1R1_ACTMO|nr:VOC family protein [Actinopolyspora mortivallis]PRW65296.1 glyoxalase [Actinopolyspora mortivallis]